MQRGPPCQGKPSKLRPIEKPIVILGRLRIPIRHRPDPEERILGGHAGSLLGPLPDGLPGGLSEGLPHPLGRPPELLILRLLQDGLDNPSCHLNWDGKEDALKNFPPTRDGQIEARRKTTAERTRYSVGAKSSLDVSSLQWSTP